MSNWVSVREAAIRNGVSVRTIWRLIRDFNLDTAKESGNAATLVNLADVGRATRSTRKGNPNIPSED